MAKEKQNFDNVQRLKQKLTTICQKQRFCGICLESAEKLWSINTEFDISVGQLNHKELLTDIIDYILNNESQKILASLFLCSHCTEKSIQSYLFIRNAKQLSNIIYECVDELYSKTVDLKNQFQSLDCYQNANVVILLEQEHEMSKYIDIGKTTEIVATETSKNDETAMEIAKADKDQKTNTNQTEVVRLIKIDETQVIGGEDEYILKKDAIDEDKDKKYVMEKDSSGIETDMVVTHVKNKKILPISSTYEDVSNQNIEITFINQNHPEDDRIDNSTDETTNKNINIIPTLTKEEENISQDIEIIYLEDGFLSSEIDTDKENTQVKIANTFPKKNKKAISVSTYKCTRCREVLPSYKCYKDHLKICKKLLDTRKDLFKCKICNVQFYNQRSLNAHYKAHSKVTCKVCQFIVSKDDLQEHVKINHAEYAHLCTLCNFFCFTAERLKKHTEKNHSGPQCALCLKRVKENDLKLHRCKFNCLDCLDNVCIHYKYLLSYKEQVQNNVTRKKCVDCDYIYPRRESLIGHVNREHLDHHPFTCDLCQQQFYSRTTLRYHINLFHKEKHVCERCDQEYASKITLENHKKQCQCIEKDYKCDKCKSSFATLVELRNHVKLRHEAESFNCNLCKKKFLNNVKLHDHMFKVHSGVQIKKKRSFLTCPICDKKCESKKQLLQHVGIHGPYAKFPCKDCNEVFNGIRKLHNHIRTHYEDVIQCVDCKKVLTKTFFPAHMVYCNVGREEKELCTCEFCGKTFTKEIQLKYHRNIHLERVPCPVCKKPTKPLYLKTHMKRLHSRPRKQKISKRKIKKNIKCEWCGHLVYREGELETHVNRFHLKVKPYQCNYCQKTFFGKERLKEHLNTHTTARTCYCTICNQKCENKVCLKLHMRKHTGLKPYTCDVCGDSFSTSSIMNTHKVKKHSEKTVACPLCESMFHLTRDMRSHFKKVHWKQKHKKFDPRDVKELSPAFYHLFEDGRLPKVDSDGLCISSQCNEKYE